MEPGEVDYALQLRTCEISEVTELLERVGDINVRGELGKTALHDLNDVEKFKILIKHGADVNRKDLRGRTPLHCVQTAEMCRILLKNGADVDAKDSDGSTPLHYVRSLHICEILIENGANVDNANELGNTPLMEAVLTPEKRTSILHALLYHNADPKISNVYKETALGRLVTIESKSREVGSELIEILYNFTYDQYKEPVHWKLLTDTARIPLLSHVFLQLLESCMKVEFSYEQDIEERRWEQRDFLYDLFKFEPDNLKLFLNKFKHTIVNSIQYLNTCTKFYDYWAGEVPDDLLKFKQVLDILDDNCLLEDLVELFAEHFNVKCHNFVEKIDDLEEVTAVVLTFISYGLEARDTILDGTYNKFGFCELFRILLHCDFAKTEDCFWDSLITRLIYDIHLTIDICMDRPVIYIGGELFVMQLLEQFVHPKLKEFCLTRYNNTPEIVGKVNRMPKMSTLLEVARNAARRHIVDKFKMKNPRQLYTYIENLNISRIYKDILCLRKKLYH